MNMQHEIIRAAHVSSGDDMSFDNEGVRCTEQLNCPVCGDRGNTIHSDLRDRIFGAPGKWSTRQCGNVKCGLAWLNPQPLPGDVIKFYETYFTHSADDSSSPNPAPVDLDHWRSRGWRAKVKASLGKVFPWWRFRFDTDLLHVGAGAPGRALEVGCGSGGYLRVLKAAGWDVTGIDFDPNAIAAARRAGISAEVSDLFSMNFASASFDAIVMDNVLEHLADPHAVFAESHRIMGKGGRLVCITPNVRSFLHEMAGADWRGLEVPRHLCIFSPEALRTLANDAGFTRIDVFTQPRGERDSRFMMDQSRLIAERSGRVKAPFDARKLSRASSWRRWFSKPRGDFIILVAEK